MLRRVFYLVSGCFLVLAVVSAAFAAGYSSRGRAYAAADEQYPLLAEAQGLINQYYLREQPPAAAREYGAIRGMLGTLNDKFTFFIEAPVAASESNVLAGTYGGVGVQVKRDEVARFILFPFRDSPAAKAGIRDNDILLAVNGTPIQPTIGQDAVDQLMRGEVKEGSGVSVTVQHQPDGKQDTLRIAFAVIDVPSVVWRVLVEAQDTGYIQVMRFTNRTPDEVNQAISELKTANVKALVLDLRNNPGGLLDECVKVAGQFLNGGPVYIEKTRDKEQVFSAPENSALTDLPLVALVNGGTASAAELVAGALHDRARAKLIGQQTYGKGSVQYIFALADKSSIHVTTAEWFAPLRGALDGKGLTPDIAMIPDPTGRDVELGEAVRQLHVAK